MDTKIKSDNKIPGCDQLTRPDEIAALSKYLGEIKKIQEEHTSLDKDSLEVPGQPSFKETDKLEDTIIQGDRGKDVALGEQVIGLDRGEDISLEDRRLGIENKKIETLETKVQGLDENNDLKKLEDRVIGEKINTDPTLSDVVENLSDSRNNELEDEVERLGVKNNPRLSDIIEGLNVSGNNELSDIVEKLETEQDNKLGDKVEKIKDENKVELGDIVTSFPGPLNTPDLSSYIDNLENPSEEVGLEDTVINGEALDIDSLENQTEKLKKNKEVEGLEDGVEIRPGETIENELGKEKLGIEEKKVEELGKEKLGLEREDNNSLETQRLRLLGTRFGKLTEDELYQTLIKMLEEDGSDWAQRTLSLVSTYLSSDTISLERAEEFEELITKAYVIPGSSLASKADQDDPHFFRLTKLESGMEQVPAYNLGGSVVSNLLNSGATAYLRQIVEWTVGWLPLGFSSLRVKLINEALALEVYGRWKLEKLLGTNKDRLPGSDSWKSLLGGSLLDGTSGKFGFTGWDTNAGLVGNLTNVGSAALNVIDPFMGNNGRDVLGDMPPQNRPATDDGIISGSRTAQNPAVVNQFYTEHGDGGSNPGSKLAIPGSPESDLYRPDPDSKGHDDKTLLSEQKTQPFNRSEYTEKGRSEVTVYYDKENAPHHKYFEEYYDIEGSVDTAKGLVTTLEGLCNKVLDADNKEDIQYSNITLEEIFENSDYITTASKVNKGTTLTLDTNMYWEVKMIPYTEKEDPRRSNGGISFLPSVQEINTINKVEHGFLTSYNKWIPISGFELQKSKLTTKSLGLFDGEINYPITSEFTNEFRITVVDDQWKSWRHYFQKCSDVAVYNSETHDADYYNQATVNRPTAVDKDHFCASFYKNITFKFEVYVMTPQYSTIRKLGLLCVLKDFSEEYSGEIESGGNELNISFSIVGEISSEESIYNDDIGNIEGSTTEEATPKPNPKKPEPSPEKKQEKKKQQQQAQTQTEVASNNNEIPPVTGEIVGNQSKKPWERNNGYV